MPSFPCPSAGLCCLCLFPWCSALTHLPDIIGISRLSAATNTPTLLHFLCFLFSTVLPSLYFDIFVSVGISTVLGGRHRSAILNPPRLFLGKLSAQFSCVCCFWCIVSCLPGVSSVRLKTCKSYRVVPTLSCCFSGATDPNVRCFRRCEKQIASNPPPLFFLHPHLPKSFPLSPLPSSFS